MLDLMTFYSDLWLAIRKDGIQQKGDHVFAPYGTPNSWADGRRMVFAQDCVDFDITLLALNKSSATLQVRHVPPQAECGKAPADWMLQPVSELKNNWFQIEKITENGFIVGVGQELFDAEIHIALPSGIIESASLYNPVRFEERTCMDAALADCGPSSKGEIIRRIFLVREPPGKS